MISSPGRHFKQITCHPDAPRCAQPREPAGPRHLSSFLYGACPKERPANPRWGRLELAYGASVPGDQAAFNHFAVTQPSPAPTACARACSTPFRSGLGPDSPPPRRPERLVLHLATPGIRFRACPIAAGSLSGHVDMHARSEPRGENPIDPALGQRFEESGGPVHVPD
jgi:hypothetical protein